MKEIAVFAVMIAVVAFFARGRVQNMNAISAKDWLIYLAGAVLFLVGVLLYAEYSL